MFVADVECP